MVQLFTLICKLPFHIDIFLSWINVPLAARGQPTVFMQPMTPCIRPQGIQLSNGSDIASKSCVEHSDLD